MFERRQTRQQYSTRLAFVSRERQSASQDVTRRQHAKLVAQLSRAPAAVEHRDHGVEGQPGIRFETADQTGESGSAAEATNVERPQAHASIALAARRIVNRSLI
jgi:hypothetical protein